MPGGGLGKWQHLPFQWNREERRLVSEVAVDENKDETFLSLQHVSQTTVKQICVAQTRLVLNPHGKRLCTAFPDLCAMLPGAAVAS